MIAMEFGMWWMLDVAMNKLLVEVWVIFEMFSCIAIERLLLALKIFMKIMKTPHWNHKCNVYIKPWGSLLPDDFQVYAIIEARPTNNRINFVFLQQFMPSSSIRSGIDWSMCHNWWRNYNIQKILFPAMRVPI